jgi:hypothetical protein
MDAQEASQGQGRAEVFTPFWPLCLSAFSLAILLGWMVTQATRQRVDTIRLLDQQALVAQQAAQAEGKLQAMMMDLLELAKSDADAKALVTKYRITFKPNEALAPPQVQPAPTQAKPPEAAAPGGPGATSPAEAPAPVR